MTEVRLKDIARINARTLPESTDPGYEFRYIDIGSINGFGQISIPKEPIRFGDAPSRARRLAPPGSTVVSTVRTYLRAVARVPETADPLVFSTGFAVIEPLAEVDPRFLGYYCHSEPFIQEVVARSVGVSYPAINASELGNLKLELPPLEEQRRVADFLDAETRLIDRMVTLREQQISLLRDHYTVAITEHVVPGSTTASRRSDVWPWLPADLRIGRLGYFARIQTGVTVDASRTVSEDDVEVPYLRVANVQDEHIDLSEIKTIRIPKRLARKSTLRAGDVVMTEANGNPDNLGRGAVWDGSIPRMVHQNHIFSIRTDNDRLLPEHLAFLLASAHGRRYFRFTSNQVGIATTSSSKVLGFPIPVLGIDEQRKAVDACTRLRARSEQAVRALQRQIDLLIERRSSLITAAVTGRIDVSTARGSAR